MNTRFSGKSKALGPIPAALTENDLKAFDQDHYGGFEATDLLAEAGDIRGEHWASMSVAGWEAPRDGWRTTWLQGHGTRFDDEPHRRGAAAHRPGGAVALGRLRRR